MSKLRVGHKQNSYLNNEWASHVKKSTKKLTASIRRQMDKTIIKEELENKEFDRYPRRKRKEKNWVVERGSVGNFIHWKRRYGTYHTKKAAIDSVLAFWKQYNNSEFWKSFYGTTPFRIKNKVTGETEIIRHYKP